MYTAVIETKTKLAIGDEEFEQYVHFFEYASRVFVSDTAVAIVYGDIADPAYQYIIPMCEVLSIEVIKE